MKKLFFLALILSFAHNVYAFSDANDKLKIIGKPISRIDGYDKVSGTATYTFDINLPRMAHAKILRSSVPHAKIKSIDTSKAKSLPGVLGILSSQNAPEIEWFNTSILFDKQVKYEGD